MTTSPSSVSVTCTLASEIMGLTNDGNDLSPAHLSMVELAVNSGRSDLIRDLHREVITGKFKPFWPYAYTQHVVLQMDGYVKYKGIEIEHFSDKYKFSARAHRFAMQLEARCQHYESIGVPITSSNVCYRSDWFETMKVECPYLDLLVKKPEFWKHKKTGVLAVAFNRDTANLVAIKKGNSWCFMILRHREGDGSFITMLRQDFEYVDLSNGKRHTQGACPLPHLLAYLEANEVPKDLYQQVVTHLYGRQAFNINHH